MNTYHAIMQRKNDCYVKKIIKKLKVVQFSCDFNRANHFFGQHTTFCIAIASLNAHSTEIAEACGFETAKWRVA